MVDYINEFHKVTKVECDKFYDREGKHYENDTYMCKLFSKYVDVEGKTQERVDKVPNVDIIELIMPSQIESDYYKSVVLDAYPDKLGYFVFEPDSSYTQLKCRVIERRKGRPGSFQIRIDNYLECQNEGEKWMEEEDI